MSRKLSKRAIEGRNWRVSARQKRRLNIIISEYVRLSHQDIYNECKTFYNSVVEKYTEKQNLSKTEEFRLMVKNHNERTETASVSDTEQSEAETTSTNSLSEAGTPTNDTEQEEAEMAGEQLETVTIGATYVEPKVILNEYIVSSTPDILSQAMNDTIGDELYDSTQDMESIVREIINDIEMVEPDIFNAEDEGIDLNVQDELENMVYDYNIDNNLW